MGNPLNDIVPAQYRKLTYAVLALVLLTVTVWQAAEGNWGVFLVTLLGTLSNTTAASNTTTSEGRRLHRRRLP